MISSEKSLRLLLKLIAHNTFSYMEKVSNTFYSSALSS